MTYLNQNYRIGYLLIILFVLVGCKTEKKDVISSEALINLDSRMLFASYVNNSPGDGMDAEVNPPRFRWFYSPNPTQMRDPIRPSTFRFQVADNKEMTNPFINIDTEINFYNELAPFPEGKTYYWRVGYILYGEKEPSTWTKTFSVNIPKGTPKWDRSLLQNPGFSEHPRLMFNKDQLEDLKKLASEDPVFQEVILGSADRMTQHKWWNEWPKTDLDKPDYTYGFYFRLCQELTKTAFAYLITQDEKYENILTIWKTIASYPIGGASSPELMGIGTESEDNTSITEYLACVYDWFYEDFSPSDRKIFENALEWRISAWMYDFTWGGALYTQGSEDPRIGRASIAVAGSEHSWEGALDTYPAAIVLYEKSGTARRFFHWISNYIISVGELISQNGGYDNGAAYGQSHMKWLTYQLMYLSTALPGLQMGSNPLYRQYCEFFMGLVPAGMKYSHFGRLSQHGAGMQHHREVFKLLAYLMGNSEILYDWKMKTEDKTNMRWRQWIHVAAPLLFKGELKPAPSTKTNFLFPATGYVMVHSAPPSDPKTFQEGVGVIFCSRPTPGDEYNNETVFQMYAYGQYLNYGGHSGDENAYGFQTIAHNTIMVDGIGQTITKESRDAGYRSVLLAYKEGDDYTYWLGDATNAYPRRTEIAQRGGWSTKTQLDYDETLFGEKGPPKLERFRRHMLFMRNKYLVVYDDLETAPERPSRFSWRYRILPESNALYDSAEGKLTYKMDDVKVIVQHIAFPEIIDYTDLKDLDQYKNPITGNNYRTISKWVNLDMEREMYRRKVCQHNIWFTTNQPKNDHNFLTVVYPVKPGTGDPVISRLDNNTVMVEKDGEKDIISFDKNTNFPATLIIDLEAFRKPVNFAGN